MLSIFGMGRPPQVRGIRTASPGSEAGGDAWRRSRAGVFLVLLLTMSRLWAASGLPVTAPSGQEQTVRDFGAKGDGVADDTAAIQSAIGAAGITVVPPGIYRTTKTLRLSDGQGLVGEGTLAVDFDTKNPGGDNAAVLVDGSDVHLAGIRIRKKSIDGSYASGILVTSGHKNIAIRGVEISGYSARYGIHIIEADGFEVSGCAIHDFMMDTAADMIVDSPAGIRITRSKHGVVSNNRLSKIEVGPNGRESISPLKPDYGPQQYQSDHITMMQCSEVSVTGNVMETSGEGIDLLLSRHCVVSGNVIGDIWFQGIKMLGASRCAVIGNSIRDCYQGIGLANHPAFGSPCFGNTITGNSIFDTGSGGSFHVPAANRVKYSGTYGIDVHEGCDENVISSNVILDTQEQKTMKGAIFRSHGKGNVYTGNIPTDEGSP